MVLGILRPQKPVFFAHGAIFTSFGSLGKILRPEPSGHNHLGWYRLKIERLIGQYLIAEEELTDPNFNKTVVLMIDHDEKGALGLVINRPAKTKLSEVLPHFVGHPSGDMPIYYGGPVQPEFMFVLHKGLEHYESSENAFCPIPGVYFEPDSLRIMEYCLENEAFAHEKVHDIRFYLGYSGWGVGQVEREIQQHSWVTLRGEGELVFHPKPQETWQEGLRAVGGMYKILADYGWKPGIN
jgi:putative transcriptional regulator